MKRTNSDHLGFNINLDSLPRLFFGGLANTQAVTQICASGAVFTKQGRFIIQYIISHSHSRFAAKAMPGLQDT